MARISDTLYAKYIFDRYGQEIAESEHGFIIYRVSGPEIFIVEMCIDEAARQAGHGTSLVNEIAEKYKECTVMTGNVWLKKKGADVVLASSLRTGFKVTGAQNDILLIAKDLMED